MLIVLLFRKNKDIILNLTGEINGFKQSLRRAQEKNETLTLLHSKLENEVEHLKRQIENIGEQRERLMDNYSMYSKTLAQSESELTQVLQVIL
jgi:chromosome segregation ATPase